MESISVVPKTNARIRENCYGMARRRPQRLNPIPMRHLQCERVDDFYLLRDGASGIFLAASQFPKNRETRAPLVEEILSVKDQLDPKYRFLATAPVMDPDGNKAQIRFSRKTKEQYVLTEIEKKPSGWKAFYREGQWEVEVKEKSRTTLKKKINTSTRKKKVRAKKSDQSKTGRPT